MHRILATQPTTAQPAAPDPLRRLAFAFSFFNGLRTLAYLPTVWSIGSSGQSDQHSLFTWFTWFGANATMAAWVHAHNGRQLDRVVLVNLVNAAMCLLTGLLIAWYRW